VLPEVQALIAHFGMTALPSEGTLFKATYRRHGSDSSSAMLGLYCDDPPSHSLFHRLPVDEVWHFHAGDPLRLVLLHADGSSSEVRLGPEPLRGHHVQVVVPAGTWQAGHLVAGGRYALFGCTVVPAFESTMYEGGERDVLLPRYPERAADIQRLGCTAAQTRMPPLPGEPL
jgi:predicted cupin superfamily sugar epimerase